MALAATGNQEPVTALWFAANDLFAGAGSFLKVFDWAKGVLQTQRQIFAFNKIHGITRYKDDLLVVWGGNSYAVVRRISAGIEIIVPEQKCKDWIVDMSTGPVTASPDPVLYIQTAHNEVLETTAMSNEAHRLHICDERSILYSGKLFISDSRRLAAAGTVFGGVVVWDLDTDAVLHAFTEHEGSIFDVAWSLDGQRLASCSDDRAIIVWDLRQGRAVAKGWGHISRIWRLRFASDRCVVSAAEDCTARVWMLDDADAELHCVSIFSGHKGRNVWSCAINIDSGVVATGGGDGRIMLWDLAAADGPSAANELKWNMQSEFGAAVRSCAVNSRGTVAVTTVDGRVWLWRGSGHWIASVASLPGTPLIAAVEDLFIVVSLAGHVFVLSAEGDVVSSGSLGHAVQIFHVLSSRRILVQTPRPDVGLRVYDVTTLACVKDLELPKEGSIITCAAQSRDLRLLCVGTRLSGLALYDLTGDSGCPIAFDQSALGRNDAMTMVKFSSDDLFVTVTSRSTEYGSFSVPTLAPLVKNRARRKGSVEGYAEAGDGLVFWGFQNDMFNVWNASLDFEIASTSCGGVHRAWGVGMLDNCREFMLCYVRSPLLVVHKARIRTPKFEHTMIQPGTHGREIRGMEVCPINARLVATGSEDTFVSIGWINENRIEGSVSIRNGHVSGIQCLHWDNTGRYLFTGAGQGELVMWGVNTVGQTIFAREVSRMPSSGDLHDLRVMDFSVLGDLIAVVYSDSSFRVWQFGETWTLLLHQKYRECCLLNIDMIDVDGSVFLLISSTDGHLVVYALDDKDAAHANQVLRYRLHQSGIRASALVPQGARTYRLYTGGDDNALRAVELVFDTAMPRVTDLFDVPGAHASALTAIAVSPNKERIFTTSSDQKVKAWSPLGGLLGTAFSDVSDTGVLVEREGKLIAGGLGVEFLAVQL